EMVLVRGRLSHAISDHAARNALYALKRITDSGALDSETQTALRTAFDALDSQRRRLEESDTLIQSALSRLQVNAMELRVVPVDTVFKRFPRVVRDIAQLQGKRIRLEVSGQEVRIDKAMIEVLADPLLHMVRNAADHGVEPPDEREAKGKHPEATLTLSAMQRGNRVVVQVTDDGRGIDKSRVLAKAVERGVVRPEDASRMSDEDIFQLLFAPGFSTAEKVTETSGRGVGMDVVRNNVMRLGGAVQIESVFGQGSTFTLTMPLSAAVQEVLLVETDSQVLALPARYVEEVIEVERADAQSIKGRAAILLRGAFLPLAHIADLLGFTKRPAQGGSRVAVVLGNGQHTLGLLVDRILGRQELFIKDIHPRLMALPGVGGASILGDGRPVLILDGEGLLRLAEKVEPQALDDLLAA
ncbi:MAG: chemotaxis protein CheA, partial [Rhodocyclaceae bacterium]